MMTAFLDLQITVVSRLKRDHFIMGRIVTGICFLISMYVLNVIKRH
jgi:hypothetical protein